MNLTTFKNLKGGIQRSLFLLVIISASMRAPAADITVPNFSFEYLNNQPVTTRIKGVTPDNWNYDVGHSQNGPSPQSSDGNVCVAIAGIDSIYQTLSETAAADTVYTLKFDGYYHYHNNNIWDCTFRGILYYDSGNSRVEIGYVEYRTTTGYGWETDCTLDVTIPSGHPAVGKPLGIELAVVEQAGSTFAFDNVRLTSVELRTSPATFYVDSLTGSDNNTGLAPDAAWQTPSPVNKLKLIPGDHILFKAGTRYTGQLAPSGSGASGNPVTIDMYGAGDKPLIEGQGLVNPTLLLQNIEYIEVNHLQITNTGPTPVAGRMGVYLHLNGFGTAHDVKLRNLHVRDVNGSNVKSDGGGVGIKWQVEGGVKSRYDGLLIENCHLERCDRDGIKGGSAYWKRDKWYPSLNVVIRGNLLEDIGGDGIVVIGTDGALAEYNTVLGAGLRIPQGDAAAGIWPWSADNTVIQHNAVIGMSGPWDAQGYDSDWNTRNTLIQYNYSQDNLGGFLLICTPGDMGLPGNIGNDGTIVRYNISVNDGFQETVLSPTFHISGNVTNTKIYNNTVYISQNDDLEIFNMNNWGGVFPDNTEVYNNIFHVTSSVTNRWRSSTNNSFSNNVWYGNIANRPGDEANQSTADPLLFNAGGNSAEDYKVTYGSPVASAGLPIADNGGLDYFGNAVASDAPPTLGAHEYSSDPVIDSDRDKMPDHWETAYALNPADPADAQLNSDFDALLNSAEYAFGGNPLDGSDTGYPISLSTSGSNLIYVYPRRIGSNLWYRLQTSNTLMSDWVVDENAEAGTEVLDTGFESVTNEVPITGNAVFVRLVVD